MNRFSMNKVTLKNRTALLCGAFLSLGLSACQPAPDSTSENAPAEAVAVSQMTLAEALQNPARSDRNKARDQYRNPAETLDFFGVTADMTVVEIAPGGGWYSEILAPYLKESGQLYAAHFPANSSSDYYIRSRTAFAERIATDESFANVVLTEFAPNSEVLIAPDNSADVVLTFRNLHNWYMGDGDASIRAAFQQFYTALKPGGVLGVVEHRLPESRADADMQSSGYMKQSLAVRIAEEVGFELVASSEINANPMDTADHPRGVWTLPPSLRLGEENRDAYLAIGESDRFTLKFVKPQPTSE